MSSELYEKFMQNNKIDVAIFEAEKEVESVAELIPARKAKLELDKKYHNFVRN